MTWPFFWENEKQTRKEKLLVEENNSWCSNSYLLQLKLDTLNLEATKSKETRMGLGSQDAF